MIYFDSAASTRPSKEVLDTFYKCANESFENPSSIHYGGVKLNSEIDRVRNNILNKLGLDSSYEVLFTSGATESNNLGILGYARKNKNKGNRIITTKVEHESVLNAFRKLESEGFEVIYLDLNKDYEIDLDYFKSVFTSNTILVSIMPVNNEVGFALNVEDISKIVKENPKCALHIDAAQTLGKLKFDYSIADLITISGHKIHGLKGIAALIKKKRINLEPLVYGGGQEHGIRSGTLNYPLIMSFNVAINDCVTNMNRNLKNIGVLQGFLLNELKKIDEVILHEPKKATPCIVNFSLKTKKGSVVVEALSNKNIYVSSVSACNSKSEPVSYVLLALGRSFDEASNSIRISLSKDNTLEECETFIKEFKEVLATIRSR